MASHSQSRLWLWQMFARGSMYRVSHPTTSLAWSTSSLPRWPRWERICAIGIKAGGCGLDGLVCTTAGLAEGLPRFGRRIPGGSRLKGLCWMYYTLYKP